MSKPMGMIHISFFINPHHAEDFAALYELLEADGDLCSMNEKIIKYWLDRYSDSAHPLDLRNAIPVLEDYAVRYEKIAAYFEKDRNENDIYISE